MKQIINERTNDELEMLPSNEDVSLVCTWWDRKQDACNGLSMALREANISGGVIFQLDDQDPESEGYGNLLHAKIYQTFGVYDPNLAAKSVADCLNSSMSTEMLNEIPSDKRIQAVEAQCNSIISLFQEFRPKDAFELMAVTKMIILNFISNKEFVSSVSSSSEFKTIRQNRGVKLSRLMLEFKTSLDKHRRPEQRVTVQHNHVNNVGNAIIGSQLNA